MMTVTMKKHSVRIKRVRARSPALPLTKGVALGRCPNLSAGQFAHL